MTCHWIQILVFAVILGLPIVGCSGDDDTQSDTSSQQMNGAGESATASESNPSDSDGDEAMKWGPEMPKAGEWIQVEPGGETTCSRNTPFRFFVRGGRTDRIVVFLQGGGACWDELTCSVAGAIFSEEAPELSDYTAAIESGLLEGLFDTAKTNLFHDWTILYLPYCTGDIYWGNTTKEYNDVLSIEHRGFYNTSKALEWLYARVKGPESVFVGGCSAGAYGSVLHGTYVAQHYKDSKVAVLADSGAGIITPSFLKDSFPNWKAQDNLPEGIEALQAPPETLSIEDVYIQLAEFEPNVRFAQYSTAFDADQISYYTAMGGEIHDWSPQFFESIETIKADAKNFRAYVAPGSMHCILNYAHMHTRTVNGVLFADWLEQLVLGETMPDSVSCDGEECFNDPVCDKCQEDGGFGCQFCRNWPDKFRPPADDEMMP